jgi:hypothetical protein
VTLDAESLRVFPLAVGDSWIYTYEAYSGTEKTTQATWQISEAIVMAAMQGAYWVAQVQREVRLQSGTPTEVLSALPGNETYWYLFDGAQLYRQTDQADVSQAQDGWLELVFPLEVGKGWYPDPLKRAAFAPTPAPDNTLHTLPGYRQVTSASKYLQTPAGRFERCYELWTDGAGANFLTFCPGVGIVAESYDHAGTPYGYKMVLIGYLVH